MLCVASVLLWLGGVEAILRFQGGSMPVFLQLFDDVSWHGNVKCMCNVVPFESNATV